MKTNYDLKQVEKLMDDSINKMEKLITKKVTITMTLSQQNKAKKDSVALFGKENLSGYIQVLIQKGL
ncbi:MAG: hypothetical protein BV456_08960 [Thermoplasmata archaeon M8B2D]|nr:MAG: hypothetical protein BV456_08960 [Thermoplasmata archaeon M8B2D]